MNYEVRDFQKDVIEQSFEKTVLVDFWAEWCGPCKMIGPVLEKLAVENEDNWKLVKVDTDSNQEIAVNYGVRGIPNVKLFKNGKVINEFTGALPEAAVREWLKKYIPSRFTDQIEHAKDLLKKGNTPDAKVILEEVYSNDVTNDDVKVLLAKVLLFEDSDKALRLTENVNYHNENLELATAINNLAQLINRDMNLFPESDTKEKYLSAINEIKIKKFDSAIEKFIDIIKTDRYYDNDGARKACIAIFKFLGEDNEITLKYRRDFGSALYI